MRRRYRTLTHILLYLAAGAGLVFVFGTQPGLRWVWARLQPVIPASVHVGQIHGRIIGPLSLDDVDYNSRSVDVHVDHMRLDWSLLHLLGDTLDINQLRVKGVRIQTKPQGQSEAEPAETASRKPFSLPLHIHLNDFHLSDFTFRAGADAPPFVINNLRVSAGYDIHGIYLKNLSLDSPLIQARGGVRLTQSEKKQVSGRLDWHVRPPGYPAVTGHTRISGRLSDLHIRQRIESPYALQARIEVRDPLKALRWKARIQLEDIALNRILEAVPVKKLSGEISGSGGIDRMQADTKLRLVSSEYGEVLADSSLQWEQKELRIKSLQLQRPDSQATVSATGRLHPFHRPMQMNLRAHWKQMRYPLAGTQPLVTSPSGRVRLEGSLGHLLARFQARIGQQEGRIQGRARFQESSMRVHMAWQDLGYPLANPRVVSHQGKLDLSGTLDAYRVNAEAMLARPDGIEAKLDLAGQGSLDGLSVNQLNASTLDGQVQGQGKIAWSPALRGHVSLKGEGINPGVIRPQWPGKIRFQTKGSMETEDGRLQASLQNFRVDGELRNHPLSVDTAFVWKSSGLNLDHLRARYGSNSLKARGQAGKLLDLNWRIQAHDLSEVLPQAHGSLTSHGQVQGKLRRPVVQARIQGKSLAYDGDSLDRISLRADVDMTGRTVSNIALKLGGVKAQGMGLSRMSLNLQGTPAEHHVHLKMKTPALTFTAALEAGLDQHFRHWRFRLTHSTIDPEHYGQWHLKRAAGGLVSTGEQRMDTACWASKQSSFCLNGKHSPGKVDAGFKLHDLPIAYFAALLPATLETRGRVSGRGRFTKQKKRIKAQVKLNTTSGRITLAGGNAKKPALEFNQSQIHLSLDESKARLMASINLASGGELTARAHLTPGKGSFVQRGLQGRVHIAIEDLSFLPVFAPQVDDVRGHLIGDLKLAGTLAAPRVNGRLALKDGRLDLLMPGIILKKVRFQLNAGGRKMQFEASAHSGGGALHLAGTANLQQGAPHTHLHVTGHDFQAVDLPVASIYISPDMKLDIRNRHVRVRGEIAVPRASITPKTIPSSGAVTVAEDQEIVRPGEQKRAVPLSIESRVRVVLGKDVHFDGFGLTTGISGQILTISKPGKLTRASGQIELVNGQYKAYGQNLKIKTGRMLFSGGPVNNPGIELRAVRPNLPTVTVGVKVTGTVRKPEISLFSRPSMSQQEKLSWLVLGRPLNSASGSENSALNKAALALGIRGGNYLSKNIGSRLGLDTFTLQAGSAAGGAREHHTLRPPPGHREEYRGSSEQASLVLGKYLTPKLFVSYGFGLFDRVSSLRLRYTLSKHWFISSESSRKGYGGDINFTIER